MLGKAFFFCAMVGSLCILAELPFWPQTRDGTHVLCIGRWIFNCWTTREVCFLYF